MGRNIYVAAGKSKCLLKRARELEARQDDLSDYSALSTPNSALNQTSDRFH
ncbi:hypothetical protein IQ244_21005 [Nostoc sp. LEGE 06077]|uniref:hypothetical protein n=1 Tax=Nostoc sp. LEGE 06077 TaxID=915325 RepID=UPI00187F125B|nr:hypothetical protein [Nostoc sp. LEGE 06077]MBE9208973.1 hypothetical protein [Nostoc sp. LEGE 06077]